MHLYNLIQCFDFFLPKIHRTKTVCDIPTSRIMSSERPDRVRICESHSIATKAAIFLWFKLIRIDGGTMNKVDRVVKYGFIVGTNHWQWWEYDKTVLYKVILIIFAFLVGSVITGSFMEGYRFTKHLSKLKMWEGNGKWGNFV